MEFRGIFSLKVFLRYNQQYTVNQQTDRIKKLHVLLILKEPLNDIEMLPSILFHLEVAMVFLTSTAE